MSRITSEMIDAGLVTEGEPHAPKGKPGRRFVALDVAGDGFHVLGLGLEASSQELALADLRGNIIAKRSIGVRRLGDPVAVAVAQAGGEVAETKRNGPVGGPS